jgi:hypothetical protein
MKNFEIITDIDELLKIDEKYFIYSRLCQDKLQYKDYKIYYFENDNFKYLVSVHFRIGGRFNEKSREVIDFRNPKEGELIYFIPIRLDMLAQGFSVYNDQNMIDYFKFFSGANPLEEKMLIDENIKPELLVIYLRHNANPEEFTPFGCNNPRYHDILEKIKQDPASCMAFSKYILKNKRWHEAEDIIKSNLDLWRMYKVQVGEN